MPTSLPAQPESWVDLLRRNGWHTVSLGKVTHEPDGYRWNFPSTYDIGRSSATFPDMRFSWNEIVFDHDKWGAQRYPLFAYADGTGRVSGVSAAWESGVDGSGQSLPDNAYPDGQMADAAIDKLREFADDGTRFCLAVGFFKPHLPFNAPKAYFDLYNPATLPGPSPASAPTGANPATTANSSEINAYTNRKRPRATAPRLLRLRLLHRRPGRQGARRTRHPRPRRQHGRRPLGRPRLASRRLRHHRQAHRPRTRARVAAHHPPARQLSARGVCRCPRRGRGRDRRHLSDHRRAVRTHPARLRPWVPRWCRCCAIRSPPAKTTPIRAMAR